MLAIKVDRSDFDRKLRKIAEYPDIIRKTVVGAISDTIDDMHTRELMEMKAVFDRPTPWVMRGLKKRYPGGRFKVNEVDAGIYFEFFPMGKSQEDVVKPHVFGGPRRLKSSERRILNNPRVPAGTWTVMGNRYPKDSYGNIPGARYVQAIQQLGVMSPEAMSVLPKGKQKGRKNTEYFVYTPKNASYPVGIAERRGEGFTIMLKFVQQPNYPKRFDYFGVGHKQFQASFPRHFNRILARYMGKTGV